MTPGARLWIKLYEPSRCAGQHADPVHEQHQRLRHPLDSYMQSFAAVPDSVAKQFCITSIGHPPTLPQEIGLFIDHVPQEAGLAGLGELRQATTDGRVQKAVPLKSASLHYTVGRQSTWTWDGRGTVGRIGADACSAERRDGIFCDGHG
jgi:hypothetical protein